MLNRKTVCSGVSKSWQADSVGGEKGWRKGFQSSPALVMVCTFPFLPFLGIQAGHLSAERGRDEKKDAGGRENIKDALFDKCS